MNLLEKYKSVIDSLIKKNLDNKEETIKSLLKNDLSTNKINHQEYLELLEYIDEKLKEEIEEKSQKQDDKKEEGNLHSFVGSLNLRFKPIYKGNMGQVAPEMKKSNRSVEEEWEK